VHHLFLAVQNDFSWNLFPQKSSRTRKSYLLGLVSINLCCVQLVQDLFSHLGSQIKKESWLQHFGTEREAFRTFYLLSSDMYF
jgi:hypothetical protein